MVKPTKLFLVLSTEQFAGISGFYIRMNWFMDYNILLDVLWRYGIILNINIYGVQNIFIPPKVGD